MNLFEYINLGEHAIKIYHDGVVVIYETPTGGDSILLVKDQRKHQVLIPIIGNFVTLVAAPQQSVLCNSLSMG